MESNVRTMKFVCLDDFDCPVYKCIETGVLWKDIAPTNCEYTDLRSCNNEVDGDPGYPIKKDLEIKFVNKYKENPYRFTYQMLDRMRCDCEAHLGVSNRTIKDINAHIDEMKKLYNSLPEDGKPEWLTYEQILNYEKEMKQTI